MKNKQKTFIKGALVLAAANFIVKIIGALLKVPLYRMIGEDGMGLFGVAYQIYTFMFIIATAGFPIAVSKMVAESIEKGDERDARRVFETARILLGAIGIVGSTVLYVFADSLAVLLKNSAAADGIRAIAPAVFFVSLVSAYRGYFQGKQNMYPTAASEVIEASTKLIIGILSAVFIMGMVINPNLSGEIDFQKRMAQSIDARMRYASTGAVLGVTVGTLLSLILMMAIYSVKEKKPGADLNRNIRSRREIMKSLVAIAIPITIGASVSSLTSLVDLATIMNRLVVNPGVFEKYSFMFSEGTDFARSVLEKGWQGEILLEKKANILYGMYTGQAQTMFNLPLTIIVALGMSVVPAISTALAGKRDNEAKLLTGSVLRITMLFALPCAVGLYVLSEPILMLLYGDAHAYPMLQKLAIAVAFVSVVSVSNSVLQAYGRVYYPVVNMVIGGICKVLMNYTFIPIWGIDGAPIATTVCYLVIALLNLACIIKVVKVRISISDMVIKPLSAALIMGAAAALCHNFLKGHIGSSVSVLLAIGIGVLVYMIVIVLIKGFKKEDILNMPKGDKIAAAMEKYKLL